MEHTNTVIIRAGFKAFVAMAYIGARPIFTGSVAAQGSRPRALVHIATCIFAKRVTRFAFTSV